MRPTVRKAILPLVAVATILAAGACGDDGDSAGDVTASTSTVAAAGESAAGSASGDPTAGSAAGESTAGSAAGESTAGSAAGESTAGSTAEDSTFFEMLDIAGVTVTDKPRFVAAAAKLCAALKSGTSYTDATSAVDVGLAADGKAKVASSAIAAYCPDQQIKMATG